MERAARIPSLGDELDIPQDRILRDLLKKRRVIENLTVIPPSEDRGKVKPEPVDVRFHHPIAQTIDDIVADDGMVTVERVAAAREVAKPARAVQQVVDRVIQTAEVEGAAAITALGGVVEHDIENDFDTNPMQLADHGLEVVDLAARAGPGAVRLFGRKKTNRVLAPVVLQLLTGNIVVPRVVPRVEFLNRHELHRSHAEFEQVGNLFYEPAEGSGMGHFR